MLLLVFAGVAVGITALSSQGVKSQLVANRVDPRSAAVLASVSMGVALVTITASFPSVVRAMRINVTRNAVAG